MTALHLKAFRLLSGLYHLREDVPSTPCECVLWMAKIWFGVRCQTERCTYYAVQYDFIGLYSTCVRYFVLFCWEQTHKFPYSFS